MSGIEDWRTEAAMLGQIIPQQDIDKLKRYFKNAGALK